LEIPIARLDGTPGTLGELTAVDLVVEAIPEELELKRGSAAGFAPRKELR